MTGGEAPVVTSESDVTAIDAVVTRFVDERAGSRGVGAYEWLVATLRAVPGSESRAISTGGAAAVLTTCNSSMVVHSLVGPDEDRAVLIEHARSIATVNVRGLALPGDRLTKNLFEEAKMPAQILLH